MKDGRPDFPRRRRSASAEAALAAEIARIKEMTIKERVLAALTIRDRFAWLAQPEPKVHPTEP
jgi:hypothetical protein